MELVKPTGEVVSAEAFKEWLLRRQPVPADQEAFMLKGLHKGDVPDGTVFRFLDQLNPQPLAVVREHPQLGIASRTVCLDQPVPKRRIPHPEPLWSQTTGSTLDGDGARSRAEVNSSALARLWCSRDALRRKDPRTVARRSVVA